MPVQRTKRQAAMDADGRWPKACDGVESDPDTGSEFEDDAAPLPIKRKAGSGLKQWGSGRGGRGADVEELPMESQLAAPRPPLQKIDNTSSKKRGKGVPGSPLLTLEGPFLDTPNHPARQVEKIITDLMATEEGTTKLVEAWTGQSLSRIIDAVRHHNWSLLQAYRRLLEEVGRTLGISFQLFRDAALAQPDAVWPERGTTVLYLRGHCDLREQSLSRRQAGEELDDVEEQAFTIRLFDQLMLLEAKAAESSPPALLFCVNDNFLRCLRSVDQEGRCANCVSAASASFIVLSRLHHHAIMALLHAAGVQLARITSITSTDPQPLSSFAPQESPHAATRAFLASSTKQPQHGGRHGQASHIERRVSHPGRLAKLAVAWPGQEVAARALLDITLAVAPRACFAVSPLALLRRLQSAFHPQHWMHKNLHLGWLEQAGMDTWARINDAAVDVRFEYEGPPGDVSEARKVLEEGLLQPIIDWVVGTRRVDTAAGAWWLKAVQERERFSAQVRAAVEEVKSLMDQHYAAGVSADGPLFPCGFSMPDLASGLPLVAQFETFPEAATCHREHDEPGKPPSIFQRAGLEGGSHGERTASLTFAGPAELVAAGDGVKVVVGDKALFDLSMVETCFSRRFVANLCDINDGREKTSNSYPCPSVDVWNNRIDSLTRLVVLSESFARAFPVVVVSGQPPASPRSSRAAQRLTLLTSIQRVDSAVRLLDVTSQLCVCLTALNGGPCSISLRATAVLPSHGCPLLVLHGLPQGSAEGRCYSDPTKVGILKNLPPQLLQARYRQPELDIANLLRTLRGLPCVSLHDLEDKARALNPASVLGHAQQSRGGTAAADAQGQLLGALLPAHGHDGAALRLAGMSKGDDVPQRTEEARKALAKANEKRREGGKTDAKPETKKKKGYKEGETKHSRGGSTRGKNMNPNNTQQVCTDEKFFHVIACDVCELLWQLHCSLRADKSGRMEVCNKARHPDCIHGTPPYHYVTMKPLTTRAAQIAGIVLIETGRKIGGTVGVLEAEVAAELGDRASYRGVTTTTT